MRVLSLHKCAKFGCFISLHEKIINNLLQLGRFQPNFRRPLAAKLLMGPKKGFNLKWWHGPPLSPCKISWKSRDARRRERTKCDVCFFLSFFLSFFIFFVYNAPEIIVTGDLVALLQQEIALVCLGRFRCGLHCFFGKENPFPAKWTDLEIAAWWRYDTSRNARENCQNLRKWVQSLCAPLRPSSSDFKENFYPSLIPHIL